MGRYGWCHSLHMMKENQKFMVGVAHMFCEPLQGLTKQDGVQDGRQKLNVSISQEQLNRYNKTNCSTTIFSVTFA